MTVEKVYLIQTLIKVNVRTYLHQTRNHDLMS